MTALNTALGEYSAYFGIVAAFLALASWLTSNYFGRRAKSARDSLRQAEIEFRSANSLRHVSALVNVQAQTLDHVYRDVRELSRRDGSDSRKQRENERYDSLVRMEYCRHAERAIHSELERIDELVSLVKTLDLPAGKLEEKAVRIHDAVARVATQRQSAKKIVETAIAAAGDVYEISDSRWEAVADAIREYRKVVEIDLVPEQNRVSEAIVELHLEVLDHQRAELARRNRLYKLVGRIALALYVLSAVLALYGKWLDARYPTPEQETSIVQSSVITTRPRGQAFILEPIQS